MDVIALAEKGISNAVATLGTATTPDHLRLLQRSAPETVFCFDGDRAGRDAAWRAAENALPLLGGNHQLKFMFLPDGEDPDTIVRQEGPEAFNQRVQQAQNYSDFFFSTLEGRVDISSMDGRARLIEIAKPYLRHIPAGVYRDMLEQQLAERAQTSTAILNKHIEKPAETRSKPSSVNSPQKSNFSPVRMAITILLQHPELHTAIGNRDKIHTLDIPGMAILVNILETLNQHPHLKTAALLERARGTDAESHLRKLAMQTLTLEPDQLKHELVGVMSQLQQQAIEARHAFLMAKGLRNLSPEERIEINALNK